MKCKKQTILCLVTKIYKKNKLHTKIFRKKNDTKIFLNMVGVQQASLTSWGEGASLALIG